MNVCLRVSWGGWEQEKVAPPISFFVDLPFAAFQAPSSGIFSFESFKYHWKIIQLCNQQPPQQTLHNVWHKPKIRQFKICIKFNFSRKKIQFCVFVCHQMCIFSFILQIIIISIERERVFLCCWNLKLIDMCMLLHLVASQK